MIKITLKLPTGSAVLEEGLAHSHHLKCALIPLGAKFTIQNTAE